MTTDAYLREVELALRDLPWSQRRDLVAELREHLAELPPDTDFGERLGAPEQYAADLRAAAGLERQRGLIAFFRARRPRNVVITASALALVIAAIGLAIGAVVWIDSYQPLVVMFEPPHAKPSLGQTGAVVFRNGRPYKYGVAILNNGRFTVRVLGAPKSVTNLLAGHLLMSKPSENFGEPLVPFHPFDLPPGEISSLVFKGVYTCTIAVGEGPHGPPGGVIFGAFPVRYGFLWRTATTPLSKAFAINLPKRNRCG